MHHRIVVTGATGHVGGEIARRLLARKERVRVVGRDAARLAPFAAQGAETAAGTLDDAAFLRRALDGADAVFAMIPPQVTAPDVLAFQRRVSLAFGEALSGSKVSHVVALSSVGADLPAGTGPIVGLHGLERTLDALSGVAVLDLRPGYFMENFLASVPLIKGQGINGGAIDGAVPIPMTATRDIGAAAAELLAEPSFEGKGVRELFAARDYTMAEATAILGRAIGRPDLSYVRFPYDETRAALVGMGLSPSMAALVVEMAKAFNDGTVKALMPRTPGAAAPTTLEVFAAVFASAYGSG